MEHPWHTHTLRISSLSFVLNYHFRFIASKSLMNSLNFLRSLRPWDKWCLPFLLKSLRIMPSSPGPSSQWGFGSWLYIRIIYTGPLQVPGSFRDPSLIGLSGTFCPLSLEFASRALSPCQLLIWHAWPCLDWTPSALLLPWSFCPGSLTSTTVLDCCLPEHPAKQSSSNLGIKMLRE